MDDNEEAWQIDAAMAEQAGAAAPQNIRVHCNEAMRDLLERLTRAHLEAVAKLEPQVRETASHLALRSERELTQKCLDELRQAGT